MVQEPWAASRLPGACWLDRWAAPVSSPLDHSSTSRYLHARIPVFTPTVYSVSLVVTQDPEPALAEYAGVPITFEVRQVLEIDVVANGLGGLLLSERTLSVPYIKDYDAIAGSHPLEWGKHFDLSNWGFFAAYLDGQRIGGAAVAFDAPGVQMLEGRTDLAVLWDVRVSPAARGNGVGAALFGAAELWAAARGCRQFKVETQNINVPACRFYVRQGCVLGAIHRFAYPGLPGEVQLLWYKDLRDRWPAA